MPLRDWVAMLAELEDRRNASLRAAAWERPQHRRPKRPSRLRQAWNRLRLELAFLYALPI